MRKWKQIVGAVLVTAFLIGLGLLDGALLPVDNSQIGEAEISTAVLGKIPVIRLKKAVYDDEGNLSSCISGGSNCVVIVVDRRQVSIAGGGILLK